MLAVTDLHFVTGYSGRYRQNNELRRAVCAFHVKNKLQKLSSGRCGAVADANNALCRCLHRVFVTYLIVIVR